MPIAAWCDQCQTNIWVTDDGLCPAGHPSSSLSGHYEVPLAIPVDTKPERRLPLARWIISLAVVFVIVVLSIGGFLAARIASEAKASNSLAEETDAFIKREYPDYTIVQRERFTNFHGVAGPGTNYFLERTGNPGFVLLVGVCKPKAMTPDVIALSLEREGELLTTDGVFSRSKMQGSWVTESVESAVIAQYVLQKPKSHALIARTAQHEGTIFLGIAADARYQKGLGYMSPLYVTKIGTVTVDDAEGSARPLVSMVIEDF